MGKLWLWLESADYYVSPIYSNEFFRYGNYSKKGYCIILEQLACHELYVLKWHKMVNTLLSEIGQTVRYAGTKWLRWKIYLSSSIWQGWNFSLFIPDFTILKILWNQDQTQTIPTLIYVEVGIFCVHPGFSVQPYWRIGYKCVKFQPLYIMPSSMALPAMKSYLILSINCTFSLWVPLLKQCNVI